MCRIGLAFLLSSMDSRFETKLSCILILKIALYDLFRLFWVLGYKICQFGTIFEEERDSSLLYCHAFGFCILKGIQLVHFPRES